jgi:hypothetical protein
VKNDTGAARTDFHAILSSANGTKIKLPGNTPENNAKASVQGGPTLQPADRLMGNNTNKVTIEWDFDIPIDKEVSYGVFGDGPKEITVENYFTPRAMRAVTDIPSLGWRIDEVGNVFLNNVMPVDVSFGNLRFSFPLLLDLLGSMALLDAPLSGTTGLMSSGIVPAGSELMPGELHVGSFPLEDDEVLVARFDTAFVDADYSLLTAVNVLGMGAVVPEPATLGLMALAALSACRRRRAPRCS